MRTANPALNDKTFQNLGGGFGYAPTSTSGAMTIQGTVNKTAVLLFLALTTAAWTWYRFSQGGFESVALLVLGGAIAAFVLALVTVFKRQWAPVTAPLYALLEGFVLGGVSALFESIYPGIVVQAVALTFGVALALLLVYTSRLVKVTQNFRLGVFAATGGIALVYIATFLLGFAGIQVPFIHDSGPIGIAFSVFVVVIAALNLVLDFDFIERGAAAGAPKFMEWFAAFGLVVTLVWLYFEILRLLSKVRSR